MARCVGGICCVLGLLITLKVEGGIRTELARVEVVDLLGTELGAESDRARAAQAAGRWDDAGASWLAVLEHRAGHREALYNLACCCAQLGLVGKSAELLAASWAAGYRDLEHLRQDPDLEPIRATREYRELLQVLADDEQRRARAGGEELVVPVTVAGSVRVVAPAVVEPGRAYPLVVVLHGAGGDNLEIGGIFRATGIAQDFIVCAPRGPYTGNDQVDPGHVWLPEDVAGAGAGELGWQLSEELVLGAVEAVAAKYPVDLRRVLILGFSQGAQLAYSLGLHQPERFWGVAGIGGVIDPERHDVAELARAARSTRFLLAHSPEDRVVPFARCEEAARFLAAHAVPHEVVRYPGGHVIPASVLERLAKWVGESAAAEQTPGADPQVQQTAPDQERTSQGDRAEAGS